MPIIEHKWRAHKPKSDTRILMLGTFHPDINTGADFFYGRKRNYLWSLLPMCFNDRDLRGADNLEAKYRFIESHKIGFADIIASVDVPDDQKANYSDNYIDKRVHSWNEIEALMDSLENLQAVYFTRKTFQGIPIIKNNVLNIQNYCIERRKRFSLLPTPARFMNIQKQGDWKRIIIDSDVTLHI
jgi:G:T/U-mismatch repair DNA glycosylase